MNLMQGWRRRVCAVAAGATTILMCTGGAALAQPVTTNSKQTGAGAATVTACGALTSVVVNYTVTAGKIKANAVTQAKIRQNAVTNAKLREGAVNLSKIAAGTFVIAGATSSPVAVTSEVSWRTRANPKSVIHRWPRASTRRFEGLMSRWITPRS